MGGCAASKGELPLLAVEEAFVGCLEVPNVSPSSMSKDAAKVLISDDERVSSERLLRPDPPSTLSLDLLVDNVPVKRSSFCTPCQTVPLFSEMEELLESPEALTACIEIKGTPTPSEASVADPSLHPTRYSTSVALEEGASLHSWLQAQ
jgi:hypothetical protein